MSNDPNTLSLRSRPERELGDGVLSLTTFLQGCQTVIKHCGTPENGKCFGDELLRALGTASAAPSDVDAYYRLVDCGYRIGDRIGWYDIPPAKPAEPFDNIEFNFADGYRLEIRVATRMPQITYLWLKLRFGSPSPDASILDSRRVGRLTAAHLLWNLGSLTLELEGTADRPFVVARALTSALASLAGGPIPGEWKLLLKNLED